MRDYDPTTGRYIEADPLGVLASVSLYGYAGQNPANVTDPNGECPWCIIAAAVILAYELTPDAANAPGLCDPVVEVDDTAPFINGALAGIGAGLGLRGAVAAEEGSQVYIGPSSVYDTSITRVGSKYPNVKTDVGAKEFQSNLMLNGYSVAKQEVGTTVLTNGPDTWAIYTRTSTGSYGAQFFGGNGNVVKYSLGGP